MNLETARYDVIYAVKAVEEGLMDRADAELLLHRAILNYHAVWSESLDWRTEKQKARAKR